MRKMEAHMSGKKCLDADKQEKNNGDVWMEGSCSKCVCKVSVNRSYIMDIMFSSPQLVQEELLQWQVICSLVYLSVIQHLAF